jgi:DNA polymerase-3 subunit delta
MVAIYANKLVESLRQKPVCVLLWGDDAGALRQATQQVIAAIGVDPADPFAAEKLTLTDLATTPQRLAESAQTLSFTSPHRLIHISGLTGEERATELTILSDALINALSFSLQAVTIVVAVPNGLEKKHPLVKMVEAHPNALSVRFFNDSSRDITSFIQTELKAAGVAITPPALVLLAEGLGADREIARRELEKLILYAGDEVPLTEAHVQASLAGATPASAFLLAEAVAAQNPNQVDNLIHQLQQAGDDLHSAWSLTLTHLRAIAHAQNMLAAGEPEETILVKSGKGAVPPAAKQVFLQAVKRYPKARIAQLPERALDALTNSRSGLIDADHVLSRALLALSS